MGKQKYGLEHAGLSVTTAAGGRAALVALRREPPDAVVTGWCMPGMRGDELLAVIRSDPRTVGLPVLFLSVFDLDETRVIDQLVDDRCEWLMKTRTTPDQLARHVLAVLEANLLAAKPKAIA